MPGFYNSYDSARYRRARPRGTGRPKEQGDVITAAITIQVIICVLLVLLLVIYQKNNEKGFDTFKREYATATGSEDGAAELQSLFAGAAEGFDDAIRSIEDFFRKLMGGEPRQKEESALPAMDQSAASGEEAQEETVESKAASDAFRYDYLTGDADNSPLTAVVAPGMGGQNPVGEGSRRVPSNSSLEPVALGAYMQPPVLGGISSGFGFREHPVTEANDFHTGIDIAAEEGRAILSALPGIVVEVGESQIYGNYIVVEHSEQLQTSYSHCSEVIAREGMVLRQGERIAKVGQTGMVTGPHLHFSVLVDGVYTDPCWVLKHSIQRTE
ncbi:M23 family metallopeptidase [Ruminococcaceae bacterium OttesenSCG-928-L11]|nr:M23 family metallopeptidase [Ruminococcaceae bacterium OttesenSCG-928-L11]